MGQELRSADRRSPPHRQLPARLQPRGHSERSGRRLRVVQVLVLSLLATLLVRLWDLQVVQAGEYLQAATTNQAREVVTPALRGMLLDSGGRPLVRNRTAMVVSVQRPALLDQPDGGRAVVARLAGVLDRPVEEVWGRTRLCGSDGAPSPPQCASGSPYQPIPVAQDVPVGTALQILEQQEDFPGVLAGLQPVRDYPGVAGVNAAHLLGYVGPITPEELARVRAEEAPRGEEGARGPERTRWEATDLVGRSGLEQQYDAELRGVAGVQRLEVDSRGAVVGGLETTQPRAGHHLVTSIDAPVQALAERALAGAVDRNRRGGGTADSGAAVVMDVRSGRVLAMASYPTYDPELWTGGVSTQEYAELTSEQAGVPLFSRAVQGTYPPASTFKVVSLPAAVQSGYPIDGSYDCPASYRVGNRDFRNYESIAYGPIDLGTAIEVSCDTVFYRFAEETWRRLGGTGAGPGTRDPFAAMARSFGLGEPTGVDLPQESAGLIPDRAWKTERWQRSREDSCAAAVGGYPQETDPARANFLTRLAAENCADGWQYRVGDAANLSIGQGDVAVTPLQLARVYAAIANGGTLWQPRVGRAVVSVDGEVVRDVPPVKAGTVDLRADVLTLLQESLQDVVVSGTAAGAFAGWPQAVLPVAGKTGTAEVFGQPPTSWFASYAPADAPRYAAVVVVSQGDTGSSSAAPAVREIWEGIFGVGDGTVDPARALLGVEPPPLPVIRPDGTVEAAPVGGVVP